MVTCEQPFKNGTLVEYNFSCKQYGIVVSHDTRTGCYHILNLSNFVKFPIYETAIEKANIKCNDEI